MSNDDEFELMMRSTWHLPGGVGAMASTTVRRVLATPAGGSQTVVEVNGAAGKGRRRQEGNPQQQRPGTGPKCDVGRSVKRHPRHHGASHGDPHNRRRCGRDRDNGHRGAEQRRLHVQRAGPPGARRQQQPGVLG